MSILKRYRYWIHSATFTALAKFYNLFINLLSFMVLARVLTPTQFGVWGLFTTLFAAIQTARISLIRSAFIRHANQIEESEHGYLQAAAFVMSLLLSSVIAIGFVLTAPVAARGLNAPGLNTMLYWCALTMLVSTATAHCEMALTASARFKAVSYIHLFRQASFLAVVCLYWILKIPLTTTALAFYHFLSIALSTFMAFGQARAVVTLQFKNYRKWMPRLWHYGKYVFGTNVSAQGFRGADVFLSSVVYGPAVSALYSAANRISNLIDLPSQVLADVAFTKASRIESNDRPAAKKMYEKTTGAILVFSLPALLVILFFPELVLQLLAGNAYLTAAPVLRITAFFGFVLPFLKQYGTIMDATGFPQISFRTNLLALVLNGVFCYAGLRLFGYLGAALGTALTYACIFVTMQRILHKTFGVQLRNVFVNMFRFYGILFTMARTIGSRFPAARKA